MMLANLLFVASLVVIVVSMLALWSAVGRDRRDTEADWFEVAFLAAMSTIILAGWAAMSLGQLGKFSLTWLALILLGVAALAAIGAWRRSRGTAGLFRFRRVGWQEYALIGLMAVAAVFYFRPHEYVLGGTDAGSYMNMGAYLARAGSFVESSSWTEMLVEFGETTLRQQLPPLRTHQLQFVGWYIDDNDASRTLPQFYPFHPALLAVAIGVGGLKAGLLAVPLWGILSMAAVYLLSRRLFNKNIALLSAALLVITPTHIFFGRYPTAEPLTLLLIFTSLYAFQVIWDGETDRPAWGIFSGAALGAATLTRIDLPLILLIVLAALAWRLWTGTWNRAWTAYAAMLILALVQQATFVAQMSWPYFLNTYGAIIRYVEWTQLLWAGLFLLALAVALLIVQRRSFAGTDPPAAITGWLESTPVRWTLAGLVVGLSLFAYFLYPIVKPVFYATSWPSGDSYPVLNGQNWVRIGWYLTPVGLAMATYGLAVILRREPLGRLAVFLLIGGLTTVQYVYNIFNTPYHIYAMRRYVPIVIPMLMIYAAYGIAALYQMQPRRFMRPVSVGIAVILAAGMLYQSRDILPQRDFAGAVDQLMSVKEQLHPDAVLVFAEKPENRFSDTLGVPLHYSFGHEIITIRNEEGRVREALDRALAVAAEADRPVQLIAIDPIFPVVLDSLRLQPVAMVQISTDMLMNTYTDYPSALQPIEYGIEVYDVVGSGSTQATVAGAQVEIDVGTLDSAYIGEGFFGKEVIPGASSMRWTTENPRVQFAAEPSAALSFDVTAMIYRPEGVTPEPVTVWLDGNQIGEFTPDDTWRTYSFDGVASPSDGYSTLEFQSPTFNPAALGINTDSRDLGFLIDKILVSER